MSGSRVALVWSVCTLSTLLPFVYCQKGLTQALIASYAPRVYLCPGEPFLPSSIDFALQNEQVDINGIPVGGQPATLTPSNLNFQNSPNGAEKSSHLTTKEPLSSPSSFNPAFLKGQTPATVPVYAIVVPRSLTSTSVYYWFFYPYNLGKDVGLCLNQIGSDLTMSISGPDVAPASSSMAVRAPSSAAKCTGYQRILGDHIGDWEHLEIRFDISGTAPRPTSIYLAAHNGGANFTWGDPTIQLYQSTHPVVFSANGSHGTYNTPGNHDYGTKTVLDQVIGVYDVTGNGVVWDTFNKVVVVNYRADASYTGAESWLAWSGFWGNQKDACLLPNVEESCTLSDGPVGPQYQTSAS
ncbi:hypothetical protein WJX74_010326 [Apatococcus lobatus]|uniref:Uncharacterized protein n=1 Tax=Apatococcus lobatus TaxID=904363 RepID=A0AAW1QUB7_9CHLO